MQDYLDGVINRFSEVFSISFLKSLTKQILFRWLFLISFAIIGFINVEWAFKFFFLSAGVVLLKILYNNWVARKDPQRLNKNIFGIPKDLNWLFYIGLIFILIVALTKLYYK